MVLLINLNNSFGQKNQVGVSFGKNLSIGCKSPIIKEVQKYFGFPSRYQTGIFDQKTLKKLQDLYGCSEINEYTFGLIKEHYKSYSTTTPIKSATNESSQNLYQKEKVIPPNPSTPIILGLSQDKTTGCKFYTYNSENRYGTWSGTCKDGLIDGSGMLRLFEGDSLILISNCTYIGGYKNGESIDSFVNGTVYYGNYINGLKEGKGKDISSDGRYYEGNFKNGKYEGKGKYVYSDGVSYDGEWKNGKQEGSGKMVNSTGDSYDGEWKNDKREGKGKYIYSNGDYYVGDFKNGMSEGKGKIVYSNGDSYVGGFKDDELNGRGTYTYKNGSKDIGIWESGKLVTRDVSSTTKLPGQIVKNTQPNQGQNSISGTKTCTYCGKKFSKKTGYVIGVEISCATSYSHASLTVEVSKTMGYDSQEINRLIWGYNNGRPYCSQKCVYQSGKTFCAE